MAIETGLKGAPNFRARLPNFVATEKWNFVPVILMMIAFAMWIWRISIQPKQLTNVERGEKATDSSSSSATPSGWQDYPSSGERGPIGPLLAAELVQTFKDLPKPCSVRVTFAAGTENLGSALTWLLTDKSYGAGCDISPNPQPPNIDAAPPPKPTTEEGIVIHYDKTFGLGQNIAHFFDASGSG